MSRYLLCTFFLVLGLCGGVILEKYVPHVHGGQDWARHNALRQTYKKCAESSNGAYGPDRLYKGIVDLCLRRQIDEASESELRSYMALQCVRYGNPETNIPFETATECGRCSQAIVDYVMEYGCDLSELGL